MAVKVSQNNADTLNLLGQANNLLAAGGGEPEGWATWPQEKKIEHLRQLQQGLQQTSNLTTVLTDKVKKDQEAANQMATNNVQPIDQSQMQQAQSQARRVVFNLKKMGQMADPSAQMTPAQATTPAQSAPQDDFSTVEGLKQALNKIAQQNQDSPEQAAIQMLENNFVNDSSSIMDAQNKPSDPKQLIRDAITSYYAGYARKDDAMQTKAATIIYDKILPDSVKGQSAPGNENEGVNVQLEKNVQTNLASVISRSNEAIKRLAEKNAQTEKIAFNLKKFSQHGTIQNVMMYGPEEKAVDQFNWDHQPISDWHLVERNKGFGLRLPGYSNIDWEKAWRENVMDKYTVPYRDKDGNWGGGYLDERFEVDRNIPVQNNMQLKPGQLRKPVLPEYGNTESRLEANRTKLNDERGYSPAEKGETFNWKKASAKKKVTAEVGSPSAGGGGGGTPPLPSIDGFKLPGEEKAKVRQSFYCSSCGDEMSVGGRQQCKKCNAVMVPTTGPGKTAPDKPGKQNKPNVFVQPGQQLTPAQMGTLNMGEVNPQMLKNAVFFDSEVQKFVVYAGQDKKKQFSSFDEAEKYAQSLMPTVPNPGRGFQQKILNPVKPQPQPAPAAPDPLAAPKPGIPQKDPAAGRNHQRNPADIVNVSDPTIRHHPKHHPTAHGLAIDG